VKNTEQFLFGSSTYLLSEDLLQTFFNGFKIYLAETYDFFEHLCRQGCMVAGYGAAERTTALLGMVGLNHKFLECIYDQNISLHGMLIPGELVPIKNSSEILSDMPDFIVIFARSHEMEILSQLEDYKNKGGKIITMCTTPPTVLSV
jgi:hypothetical protein